MWKFIQWSLATFVAVLLLAVVVIQLLSASTGRARDASVASLKVKLARLEAERPPKAVVPMVAQQESDPTPPALDRDALRKRWQAVLEQFLDSNETCSLDGKLRTAIQQEIVRDKDPELTEEDRAALRDHQACTRAMLEELTLLCREHVDLRDLFAPAFRADSEATLYGFNAAWWALDTEILLQAHAENYPAAIASFHTLVELSRLHTRRFFRGDVTIPCIIQRALASGTVDDATWQRLLDSMAARRDAPQLAAEVETRSGELLAIYENWPQSSHFSFSEYPLNYAQNWAYRHVTTPMFNHDLEKFSRAMAVLMDLAPLPYYQAKPGLEQFYEDFDVEPGVEDIKFTRANPSWRYVVELSREHFEGEAWYQGWLDMARIAILLDRHKKQAGVYPESLDEIGQGLGVTVPLCPADGAPYLYERSEETFRLEYRFHQERYLVEELGFEPIATLPWFLPAGNAEEADAVQ